MILITILKRKTACHNPRSNIVHSVTLLLCRVSTRVECSESTNPTKVCSLDRVYNKGCFNTNSFMAEINRIDYKIKEYLRSLELCY